jgi:asparagine synthase (glutamine-hydrolysing)
MLTTLAHRGPDGAHMWCEGAVGLGHLTLCTTPEARHETLPLAASRAVLTADMRLDNRAELLSALGLRHDPGDERCDSQILLAAYDKWGEACPQHLLGDFAFAIWDGCRQRLFCARDHMGLKPFYYYASPRVFVCASEIKALWCEPSVSPRVNELRVGYHLIFRDDPANTFYRDIRRLPPGHALSVTLEGERLTRYWALDPTHELHLSSNEAYAEQFEALFTEAVRCRLRTSHAVGSILSGGLDSSSITCVAHQLMQEQGTPPLHVFSARFSGNGNTDEQPYVDAVLERLGANSGAPPVVPHILDGNGVLPTAADFNRILWHQEEPFWYSFLDLDHSVGHP